MDNASIEKLLEQYYRKDMHYEDGKILGSMYTKPPDIVLKVFFKFYQANLGNAGLYPGTMEMERKVVDFLLCLTSGDSSFYGHIVSGGTEANITALWAARNMGYTRVITTRDAHFSIRKAVNLLKLKLQEVPMKDGKMDVGELGHIIKDGDIVVATGGTTPLGFIDPIEKISKICKEHNCYLHVDAAFGGFIIPFLRELGYTQKKFGFDIDAVRSITIDPHKMGMAPYPAGGLISRENIFKWIETKAPYLMNEKNYTLLGTRQSGSVAASYSAILYFGWEGYRRIVKKCMENTLYGKKRFEEEGYEILVEPEMNILNIKFQNVKKIKRELIKRGWGVSINPSYNSMRIVFMPHVTTSVVENLLRDLKNIEKS